jgi:hypothetical protein
MEKMKYCIIALIELNMFVLGCKVSGIFSAQFHQQWMRNLYLLDE